MARDLHQRLTTRPDHVLFACVTVVCGGWLVCWTAVCLFIVQVPTVASLLNLSLPEAMKDNLRGQDISSLLLASDGSAATPQPLNRSTTLLWEWRLDVAGPCWNVAPSLAARRGRYKLLQDEQSSRIELYDMDNTGALPAAAQLPLLLSNSGGWCCCFCCSAAAAAVLAAAHISGSPCPNHHVVRFLSPGDAGYLESQNLAAELPQEVAELQKELLAWKVGGGASELDPASLVLLVARRVRAYWCGRWCWSRR